MKHMSTYTMLTAPEAEALSSSLRTSIGQLEDSIDDLVAEGSKSELQICIEHAISRIQDLESVLKKTQDTIVTRSIVNNVLTLRKVAKLLKVSPATVSRQYRAVVQSPRATTGQHLSDTELARIVASFYGWRVGDEAQFVDLEGHEIGHDISQAAAAMRELGWFYDPLVPSIGVRWSIMPNDNDEATASKMVRDLLHNGMYWLYDDKGHPFMRMRDGKTWDDVQDDFRTNPKYEALRS